MDADEVKRQIASGHTAYGLLREADPKLVRRFNQVDASMVRLMRDVRKHFPDACYYTGSGGFNLLLGPSHDERLRSQQDMVALSGNAQIGDGDW